MQDNPAAGESFKEFFDRFSPQIPAIISKLETYGWGNKLTNDLISIANSTAVKAYRMYSDPEKSKLDTYASRAVRNAIYDFWDSYSTKNTTEGGSLLSLNQTNEQGKELIDTIEIEDESASAENKGSSDNLLERYARWKASLPRPVDRKILDYSEQGLPPSVIARKAGIGMTSDEVKTRLRELAVAARTEGELQFSRKRELEGTPSKKGYTVINVNNQAGQQFNNAHGVVATPELIYKVGDVPVEKPVRWIIQKCKEYALNNGIIGEHITPALGDDVSVSVGGIKNILNHFGSDIKNNLIAYIPEMLKDAGLVQTESNGSNLSHLLSTKVRYGDERFIVGMVIHENNGKYYYDHELIEIKKAEHRRLPDTTGVNENPASILNIIQKQLFSTGFDKENSKNLEFSRKRIFTGSAASYDKPSLQYIGTGEGAQAYGWGLYGSEQKTREVPTT